jgi:hypothetical protein
MDLDLTKHHPRPGELSAFRRLRFALWKGSRIEVGRGGLEPPTLRGSGALNAAPNAGVIS